MTINGRLAYANGNEWGLIDITDNRIRFIPAKIETEVDGDQITITMPKELEEEIEKKCKLEGITPEDMFIRCLERAVENPEEFKERLKSLEKEETI